MKRILHKYGSFFSIVFVGAFFSLVTFDSRLNFPIFFGDIRFGGVYLPFTSSIAIAAFATVMFEAYKIFKSY